jgi:hypothetical protein
MFVAGQNNKDETEPLRMARQVCAELGAPDSVPIIAQQHRMNGTWSIETSAIKRPSLSDGPGAWIDSISRQD